MKWEENDWEDRFDRASADRLAEVERVLGVSFPQSFRACMMAHHGARPFINSFEVLDPSRGVYESCIGVMLSVEEQDPGNIVKRMDRLRGRLPNNVIPFADDGGGDMVCLDYRTESVSEPTISYWAHETGAVLPLAESFEAFMDQLTEPVDE